MSNQKKQTSLFKWVSRSPATPRLTPSQKEKIESNKKAALERRRANRNQFSTSSTLTPAVNKMRMTPQSSTSSNSNNHNNNHNRNRTPFANLSNGSRKRNRKQYCEDNSDNSPIQPRKKHKGLNKRRQLKDDSDDDWAPDQKELQAESEDYSSPSASPKRVRNWNKPKPRQTPQADTKTNDDDDGDDDMVDVSNSLPLNTTKNGKSADPNETLTRIAGFNMDSNSNDQPFARDPNYQYKDFNEYKRRSRKRLNHTNTVVKKAAGASHRSVQDSDWYKNPRDFKGHAPGHPEYNKSQILIPESEFRGKRFTNSQAQYWRLKSTRFDGILCFKVGKFYEIYSEDADIAHKLFGLKYMGGGEPHVGFPEKSFNKYAESFVKHGYKVYRVEQTETTQEQKKRKAKLVRREVCEVITKGTIVPEEFLDESANYILSITEEATPGNATSQIDVGVCYMDYSTGAAHIGNFKDDRNRARLRTLLFQINPSEVVFKKHQLSKETKSLLRQDAKQSLITPLIAEDEFYSATKTRDQLANGNYWASRDEMPMLLTQDRVWKNDVVLNAVGGILYTLQHTIHDHEILPHSQWNVYDPTSTRCTEYLTLDGSTLANLEILRNEDGNKRGTLMEFVDHCSTKFGKRHMEQWLQHPLIQVHAINERLDAVEYLIEDEDYWMDRIQIKDKLSKLCDLERLLHHLAVLGTKGRMMDKAILFEKCWDQNKVKKLLSALKGLEDLQHLFVLIEDHREEIGSVLVNDITTIIDEEEEEKEPENDRRRARQMRAFGSILQEFKDSFDMQLAQEESIIQPALGHNAEFDIVMRDIRENDAELEEELKRVKDELGCRLIKWCHKKGKVSATFNIEIPKKAGINPERIPIEWHERGSTSTVDRYQTDTILKLLKTRERQLNEKETLLRDAARATFARFVTYGAIWKQIVRNVAVLDCLLSLAHVSQHAPHFEMTRPVFVEKRSDEKAFLEIRNCFHPCIDETQLNSIGYNGASKFIPNDTVLGTKENPANFVIVTGPNMGGKSTLLRQTCIAVILAHIGCYVPCSMMQLTPVDRIFTRVGANDRILAGQSTFMVELEETSNILMHATSNSLVILDELGRGTSTFDGTSIAYAVAKTLIDDKRCRCLFSTHYHGLCDSFKADQNVAMYHMAYQQRNDEITFLYKFIKGICDNSHGINCATLAGLPEDLLIAAQHQSKVLLDRIHSDDSELIAQFKQILSELNLK
eukprot:1498_1